MKSEKITDLEQKNKQMEEIMELSKQKWEKDQAIFRQKMEFLELQLKEERIKNDEQRQAHDTILRNIQNRERESVIGKEEASKRIQELKEQHTAEYQELERKYELIRKRLTEQIDQLTERNQELELSLKIQIEDYQKEISQLREQLGQSEEQRNRAMDTVRNLDTQKIKLYEESQQQAKAKQLELEREIEEKSRDYEMTI